MDDELKSLYGSEKENDDVVEFYDDGENDIELNES
jgi:hypothetical protein